MMEAVCGTSSLLLVPTQPFDASLSKTSTNAPPGLFHGEKGLTTHLVIAAIAYGDETYVPLQPWDVGDCTVGLGVGDTKAPPREQQLTHHEM